MKRILTIALFIGLLVLVAFLVMSFSSGTSSNAPTPENDAPNPNNEFTELPTSDIGKQVYSAYGNAVRYTLNFNTVDTPDKDALLGVITGEKLLGDRDSQDLFYVLDDKYLVSKSLVRF